MAEKKLLNEFEFMPGDIGLSTSNGFLSKLIKFFTSLHTGEATKSHAFAFVNRDIIVEALTKTEINSIARYKDIEIDVYRLPLDDKERANFKLQMLRQFKRPYGYFKLFLFMLDALSTKGASLFGYKKPVFFFTKIFGLLNIPVCSQLCVWGVHKFTKYRFRDKDGNVVNWRVVSPDYLEDLLWLPINKAKLVFSQEEGEK